MLLLVLVVHPVFSLYPFSFSPSHMLEITAEGILIASVRHLRYSGLNEAGSEVTGELPKVPYTF